MKLKVQKLGAGGSLYGLIVTALVALAQGAGLLQTLENWFYDRRAATCQFFAPKPTDKLVHLDIDDSALEVIGAWPWPRAKLAQIIDELSLAKPKAVAFDILLSEPQPVQYEPKKDGGFETIENDQLLAASLKRLGCAIVPMSMPLAAAETVTSERAAARALLERDPQLTLAELAARLSPSSAAEVEERLSTSFNEDRRYAIYSRLRREMLSRPGTLAEMQLRILKDADPDLRVPAKRVLEAQYTRVDSEVALMRLTAALPVGTPPLYEVDQTLPPIPLLAAAAAGTAFVDYPTETDGRVRRVPLFLERDGKLVPQIGLSLALMMRGQKLSDIRISPDTVLLPAAGAMPARRLPVYSIYSATLHSRIPMLFDIPWRGSSNWQRMYDARGEAHMSITTVWEAVQTTNRIIKNNEWAFKAMHDLYELLDPDKLPRLMKRPLNPRDPNDLLADIKLTLTEFSEYIKQSRPDPKHPFKNDADRIAAENVVAAAEALNHVLDQNPQFAAQLESLRQELRRKLEGKAVLVGWAATAAVADIVTTSIHPHVPGVVVHGTIFNAIMTDWIWRRVPWGIDLCVTILLGLLTTWLASSLAPERGFLLALFLAAAYLLLNGILLFDCGHAIVGVAGPVVVIASAWAGCTLARLLQERLARARMMRRFRSYVDPSLVDYVTENPHVRLNGEVRELTVCFTDLEGFTSLTERLGEKAVPILNEYMGMAAPIIRKHGALLNKFLGDGIMFFFGAPVPNSHHAARAVTTVLELRDAMIALNESMAARGLPHLSMRAGISAGEMIVGDAGAEDASDYTVLGNCVNLGARLETANKYVGSRNMLNERVAELVDGQFLLRPIAKLRVVGMTTPQMTYEALAATAHATEAQHLLAEMSKSVVDSFLSADFQACLKTIERMEAQFGWNKFTALYHRECGRLLEHPPANGFDGVIQLTEK